MNVNFIFVYFMNTTFYFYPIQKDNFVKAMKYVFVESLVSLPDITLGELTVNLNPNTQMYF